jgi:hypothetical protein
VLNDPDAPPDIARGDTPQEVAPGTLSWISPAGHEYITEPEIRLLA